ncbi:MAG: ABC transporter permease [Candidatus Poribacteria bacterium]|nr:ABC transporter permease [Candidatus Poribacteria bacterium]
MKLRDTIITGIKPFAQNKLRAGLSILGIFIGIAGVLCMIAIGDGGKKIIAEDIEKLGGANQLTLWTRMTIFKRGRPQRTTERYTVEDAYAIEEECPEVLYVLPNHEDYEILVTSQDGSQTRALLEASTADYALGMGWELQAGRFLTENDIETAAQVCVLGSGAAADLFGEESPVGQEVKVRYHWRTPLRMRVVGVMKPKGRSLTWIYCLDDAICLPLTTFEQRLEGIGYVEHLIVFFQKGADFNSIVDSAKDVLRKRHRGQDDFIGYYVPQLTFHRLEHIQKVIKIALGSIAGFSLFVSGIGIMNICLVSVGEKTREIGLRKSVGAKRIHIFCQFLTESICLCLCGGVLGIVGGWAAAHGMARLAMRIVLVVDAWPVVLSLPWILTSVIFSIVMGVGFGVYPAMQAARLSPIDALRTEN